MSLLYVNIMSMKSAPLLVLLLVTVGGAGGLHGVECISPTS